MPTLKKKTTNPYGPDDRVRAWQSFGHATGTVRVGDVLRGDDPIVREHWPWFQPVDTPTGEVKNVWSEMPAPPDHRDPGIQIGTNSLAHALPERLVRATASFWFDGGWAPGSPGERSGKPSGRGWGINIGQLVSIDHPVVRAHPEAFVFPERPVTLADVERITREIEREEVA
jgi:hypothetical protein